MKRLIGASVIFVFVAGAASAATQCVGDANRNGAVTVDEILTAVSNALNACPVGCPYTFWQETPSNDGCLFSGPYSPGVLHLDALFFSYISSGRRIVAAAFLDPWTLTATNTNSTVMFIAEVGGGGVIDQSNNSASLLGWGTKPDGSDVQLISGTVAFNADRMEFSVRPNSSPFSVAGWDFTAYAGAYAGSIVGGSAAADSLSSPTDLQARLQAAAERMLNRLDMARAAMAP